MTFSLIGRCAETGMLGVAITTSSICVASRCPWARAGAGAVSTQNVTDPTIGPQVLDLLAGGKSAAEALQAVLAASQYAEYRQVTVIDREGRTAHHSGAKTLGTHAVAEGKDCVAAGNLLGNTDVPKAMVTSFTRHADLHLAERLLRALEAGSWRAARRARSNPPGCWWWTSRSGRWSICGSTGRTKIRSRACATSGSAISRR